MVLGQQPGLFDLWPVVWLVGARLACIWAFPAFALPSWGHQGSFSELQHNIHAEEKKKTEQNNSCMTNVFPGWENSWTQKTLRPFPSLLQNSNQWWWTLEQKLSNWQTRIVNSGDTNLIVCYLDAGRPMWWSYLCDRCSTSLPLESQPAPSLQAVDLNSSEIHSEKANGRWSTWSAVWKSKVWPTASNVCAAWSLQRFYE